MIEREIGSFLKKLAAFYPIVTVVGPRQSGKTTLARMLFPDHEYMNLEAEDIRLAARSDPRSFLFHGKRRLLLDEIQNVPELLTYLQEYADERRDRGQFVLTGSHQPALSNAISQSLAGRTGIATLLPLSITELGTSGSDLFSRDTLLYRGCMPRLTQDDMDPALLYRDYYHTYIERDVRSLVNVQGLDSFSTFIRLLAGRVGQLFNKDSLARDVGVTVQTITRWMSILEASYVIFRLRPYYNNFGKRITKAPKIYFTETGLVPWLLGIRSPEQLATHPLVGNIFENYVVMEAVKYRLNQGLEPDLWFYRNASGSLEVDLLMESNGQLFPREIKSAQTYTHNQRKKAQTFSSLAPNSTSPLIVYAGKTFPQLAIHFSDTKTWCV